jgi:ubiquitin-protein ligase
VVEFAPFMPFWLLVTWIALVYHAESLYARVYEERIDLLRAAIVGPAGTPYHDGLFFFDVRFPSDYPRCPPVCDISFPLYFC